ncbi:hypothetical protein [Legionella hackeliae]|uniref:Uncharacterized protein n=1 Tax=Legionella hackeliae TaxID=449 RepID=A0A0A8UPS3_LEGHA|nr:hypothetical protein [Legionella hackeliae]KTD14863.1 hypothetical protein Lhac_0393 [Legionella hackeliae]CEK09511.1 protein of unknown function [Legionella hackeliae]STX49418.1 Uncharacterised protein [Legionella hackeliae]
MKVKVKYLPSAWCFQSTKYTPSQVDERIKLALLRYVIEDQKICPQNYSEDIPTFFIVSNLVKLGSKWSFDFSERGDDLIKNAIIDPRNPMGKTVVTVYEGVTSVLYDHESEDIAKIVIG